ncbi:hypothetical protein NQ318_008269 [Aromia moschata]|uniref:Integrase zinc-binding domain-containing protein n=1 Tax=Aromia moschata TaxID=1265417 RepID=A0AAV8XXG3_9CUCU|nr:hypothetical protein NQ318_008269 [Aromia moschata]
MVLGRGITVLANSKVILGSVEFLSLSDELLKHVLGKSDGTEKRKQLIVSRNRVSEVLEETHNGSTGRHLGVMKTLGKVREHFYWVYCTTDVKECYKKCVVWAATYRSSVHETTGQTPASITMGHELRLPCDLKFGCTPGDDVAGEDYVTREWTTSSNEFGRVSKVPATA